jgi:glutaminyl-peptide cyclotransferase
MTTKSGEGRRELAAVGLLSVVLMTALVCAAPGPEARNPGADSRVRQAAKAPATAAAPKGAPAQGAKVTFDGSKAYDYLRRIVAFGPRPAGSAALEGTRQFIKRELKALGVDVVEQPFDADTPVGRIRMVNLIARIPGASPERVIFAGHYETKLFRGFHFVGANDAGSSTAFLLEWARVLKARQNRFTTELLFLDGEEAMREEVWQDPDNRYGSRHYVQAAKQDGTLKQIRALILLDMIGDRDLIIKREGYSTKWLKDVIWGAAKRVKQDSVFVDEETPIEDDHVPFLDAGVPAVDIIDLDYLPHWHTAGDTLDKVSARSMQVVGEVLGEALPEIEKRLATAKR